MVIKMNKLSAEPQPKFPSLLIFMWAGLLFLTSLSCNVLNIPTTTTVTPPPSPTPSQIPPTPDWVRDYFINSQTGSDANPGTQSQPLKTIQKAASMATAGDTVVVQAGNYPERVTIKQSGRSGEPITFRAEGTVRMYGFTVLASQIVIQGFDISNTPDDSRHGWGIYVNGSNCIIADNYIHNATWGGILLFTKANQYTEIENCIVRNNRLERNAQVGIDIRGRNHLIENNEIWMTIQHHPAIKAAPSWADADGIHFHGSGHIVRGNYIHDILYTVPENINPHIDCFQTFFSPPYQEAASHILLERNRCENAQNQITGEVGKGFMIENASSLTIQNNLVHAYTGINASNSSRLEIINNTFTSSLTLPVEFYPVGVALENTSNAVIQNNIFFDLPGHILYLINAPHLNTAKNLTYRSDGNSVWVTNTYTPLNDLWEVNPLLDTATGYRLQPQSPAIDAGVLTAVKNDFDGIPRPQGAACDIGAYEYLPKN